MPTPAPPPSIEQLPANIPRLEPDGSNWAIFVVRFRESMQANRWWGYFDGTNAHLVPADALNISAAESESIANWDHEDLIAQYLLLQ